MHKVPSLRIKGRSLIPEGLVISLSPDAPCCSEDHFQEERVTKRQLCLGQRVNNVAILSPMDLQVTPNSGAKKAGEEQVQPVFQSMSGTKNTTVVILGRPPVSPNTKILGVQPIKQQ